MKKPFNKYFVILCIGVLIWGIETAAFGFNAKPESGAESFWDTLAAGFMIFGIIGDLLQNVRIHKHYHNITTNRINTKEVKVVGDNQKVTTKQTFNVTREAVSKLHERDKS